MDSIEYDFDERECSLLYSMAAFDLLTASECKASIMLMAQKLGDIPIPKEDKWQNKKLYMALHMNG